MVEPLRKIKVDGPGGRRSVRGMEERAAQGTATKDFQDREPLGSVVAETAVKTGLASGAGSVGDKAGRHVAAIMEDLSKGGAPAFEGDRPIHSDLVWIQSREHAGV